MSTVRQHSSFLPWLFGFVVLCLTAFSPSAQAACPETAGTTSPVVYQDCVETIDTDYDNNDSLQVATNAAVQVGDYLVLAIVVDGSNTLSVGTTSPTGWTAIAVPESMANQVNADGSVTLGLYVKTANEAGAETITVTRGGGGNNRRAVAWVMRFSNTLGQDVSSALRYALLESDGANNAVSPAITTGEVNSLVLRITGVDDDDTAAAQDSNIYGTSSTGFLNTAISMQESDASGNAVTAIAAYHLKAAAGDVGTSTTTSATGGNEEYVSYTMALRPRPYFTLTKPASGESCVLHTISIAATNTDGTVDTGYTGTITLSTSTGQGFWTTDGGDANGTLTGGSAGDGSATYTFTGADAGTIDLMFYNPNVSSVNFDIVDGSGNRELKTLANDSNMSITACTSGGAVSADQLTCNVFAGNGGTINFTHTGSGTGLPSDATANRMVVVVVGGEAAATPDLTAATATFNGVTMQSITFRREDDGAENGTQIFALNHASLPSAAGNYPVVISGAATDAAACAMTLTGVDQTYPSGDGPALPVNNNSTTGNQDVITTAITTTADNAYVIAGVSNGNQNSYTHSLGTELYDTIIGGGGATFSVSSGTQATAGSLNVTDTATGANRQTQVVASFIPFVAVGGTEYFTIAHSGSGNLCGPTAVTISAVDGSQVVDPTYTGNIQLSSDSGTGNWTVDPAALGAFDNGTSNDGIATYSFAAGDNGQVTFYYLASGTGTVNFDVEDLGDPTITVFPFSDPDLTIVNETCYATPTLAEQTCSQAGANGEGGSFSFVHSGSGTGLPSNATNGRMLVVIMGGESANGIGPATATFNGVAMQSITNAYADDGADNYTQIFALNHAALPASAGNYTVQLNNLPTDIAACAFTLTGIDQTYPTGDGAGLLANSNTVFGNENVITTQITTVLNNTLVMAGVSNGNDNSYTHSLALELIDTTIAGGGGVTFSVSAETIATAGLLSVTDTASGANRQSQVVAGFGPAELNEYFTISHAGSGGLCGTTAVTIAATYGLSTDPAYTGTIELTAGGTGDWSVDASALGTFNNGTAGDGVATYTFDSGDTGQVIFYYTAPSAGVYNFNVEDLGDPTRTVHPSADPDLTIENCEIRIIHDSTGNTCNRENITFSVVTTSGAPVTFTGSLSISTVTTPSGLSDKGTWFLPALEPGTLVDNTVKDGAATYTFEAGNDGSVTLEFAATIAGSFNFNISATGGVAVNGSYDPSLTVNDCMFRVAYTGGNTTDVCSLKEVTITVVDDLGTTVTGYTGQVNLSTTISKGTWSTNGSQSGTLTDLLANDGAASYTFNSADSGEVTLLLSVPEVGVGTMKVDVQSVSGNIQVDPNPTYDPDLAIELCTYRISVADGLLTSCSAETVTLQVYDRNSALATDYTGSVDLTTLNANGSWYLNTGNGTLLDPVTEDGEATYTFDTADNGQVVLDFFNITTETMDIDATDTLEANFREEAGFDPTLEITACLPTIFDSQCYNGNVQASAISIPAETATDSRMVLMWIFAENNEPIANTRLSLGATDYPMTLIRSDVDTDVTLEVWGILGADLPDTAATLDAAFDDSNGGTWDSSFGVRNPGMCLVAVENVEQVIPAVAAPPEDGPVNGIASSAGLTNSTLSVTSTQNNAMVFSSSGSGSNGATGMSSSLANVLWNLDNGDAEAPDSANFNGYYEIVPVAASVVVDEDTGGNQVRFAHDVVVLAPIVAGNPFATDYVPVLLFDTLAGNLSYRTIGHSLRTLPNPTGAPYTDACTMGASSASVLDLPSGSTIQAAYLYWAGSGTTADIDNVVTFGPTGSEVAVTAEEVFQILGVGGGGNLDYFAGYKEVTPLILTSTSQEYTLSDLTVQTGSPWVDTSACAGGWGLVVVFENATFEPFVNVINLFHGFQPFQNSSFTLVPRNFRMATPNPVTNVPRGLITHITFEGDDTLNTGDEVFELQNDPNNQTFEALTNDFNVGTAQYNDTVSFPDYYNATSPKPYIGQSTTSYGTDIDTYYIAGAVASAADSKEDILYPFGAAAAEQITTRYAAGQDLVLLVGEFIAVTNADLADLEVFVTSSGTMKVNTTAAGSVYIDITNNGNSAASNGFATGTMILSGIMPAGLTINTINADPQWVCTNTADNFRCTFDIETWTGGTFNSTDMIYQLDDGASLPQLELVVNTGDEVYFPLQNNTAYFSGRIAHFATPLDCSFVGVPDGEQPDPTTCTKADQFDNVNDLNKNTIDIDDLDEKQVNNNNVDRGTLSIQGVLTDLRMQMSVSGVLQQGQPAQYQLLVSNLGPDDTTKTMTVTASFDPDVAPADGMFSSDGWSCTVSSASMTCTRATALANGANSTILVDIPVVNKAEGEFASATAAVSPGTYNFDTNLTNNSATVNSEVVGLIVPITEKFLLSTNEAATLGVNTLGFGAADLILFDPSTDEAELFTADLTTGGISDVNAVHLLPNGWIVFSANGSGTFLGVAYDDEDLLIYDPILGTATKLFDGSEANKFDAGAGAANIDAVFIDYNDSWTTSTWDLLISTTDTSSLPGAGTFDDKDIVSYNLGTGTATMFFDGSDANKFDTGDGDIDGFFIPYDDTDLYYLTVSDVLATIDTNESFERDDLVTWDNAEADGTRAVQVFDGEESDHFTPQPISPTLSIDALHVVQEGYYGHFAISTVDGEVCSPGIVTIRKHAGLTHTVDTAYEGSIRITTSTGTGTWTLDGSANGTLNDMGGGVAVYTFHPDDNGEVVLMLGASSETNNININVTNGIATESAVEDNLIDIAASLVAVNYRDEFTTVSYSQNYGTSAWGGSWTEVNDDGAAGSGDICIDCIGGAPVDRLHMKDSNSDQPYIYREIAFDYDANVSVSPLTLSFKWSRSSGTTSDFFVVEYSQDMGGSWSAPVGTFGNATTGTINQNTATINLTAAGVSANNGDNLWIRFRIAGGMQLVYLTLDDVNVATSSADDCSPGLVVDHYHISSAGSLVSCLATDVIFTAHDSSHNAVEAGAGVELTINTTTGKGSWNATPNPGPFSSSPVSDNGVATYTWQAGETSLSIPFNYTNLSTDTELVGFNVVDTNTITELEEGDITVSRAGLRFFNDTSSSIVWPTLVAGMDSFTYTGQTLIVQAIKTSDLDPTACEPLFGAPAVVPIELVFECQNPTTCGDVGTQMAVTNNSNTTLVNTVDDNGGLGIAPAAEAEYTSVNLSFSNFTDGTFGAYSAGELRLNYPDVGQLQVHGRYDIRLNNSLAGTLSGNYASGSGNSFVVRPFGLEVDFSNDRRSNTNASLAVDHTSAAFAKAGVPIDTTVRAVIWNAADDLDNNGVPDFEADLSDNTIALNFGKENNFSTSYRVGLSVITTNPNTMMPNPGVPGGVTGSLDQTGTFSSFMAGESTGSNTITFNEVGIYDVQAVLTDTLDVAAAYLGTDGVVGGAGNVGRITPSYYDLNMANTMITERPDFGGSADFTYMGEQFEVTLAIMAKHDNGTTLQNYFGDFAKLDDLSNNSPEFVFRAFEDDGSGADTDWSNPLDADTDRLGDLTNMTFDSNWAAGEAFISGRLVFHRETDTGTPGEPPDGPLDLTIAVDLDDGDDVFDLPDRHIDAGNEADPFTLHFVDTNQFRYGRMVLQNAYGSEIPDLDDMSNPVGEDVSMRIDMEYWDGSGWLINEDDDGTFFDIADLSVHLVTEPDAEGDLTDLTQAVIDPLKTAGTSTVSAGQTLETGADDHPFWFQAPGEGYAGTAIMEFNLTAAGLGFLSYDWRSTGEDEDDTPDDDYGDNPRAILEFGTYQGNNRIINWQELFLND